MKPLLLIAILMLAPLLAESVEKLRPLSNPQKSVNASGNLQTNEILTTETFDFIYGILASGRLSPNLNCRLQTRSIKQERKFSTGSQWVEYLDIELFTDHFGPRSLKYSFPVGARLGRRIVNSDQGPVEEIKITSDDSDSYWFQFQHDGSRIVWAEMGSIYSFAPCLLRHN